MEDIQGFISLNTYALILILFITIVFNSKTRLHHTEDNSYLYILISTILTTVLGIILGLFIIPSLGINYAVIVLVNKLYLICLILWSLILLFYTYYISRIKNGKPINQIKIFKIIGITLSLFILVLPLKTIIENKIAVASGLAVYFTYIFISIIFIIMFILLLLDHKNMKSKKYLPIYSLAVLGTLILIIQIFTNLNYLINPSLVLIVTFMYFTIENPDVKMLNEITLAKNELEKANRVKSEFLSSMSHEIRTPLNAIVGFSELSKYATTLEEAKENSDDIINASNNLLNIFDKILQVFSLESETNEIQNEEYNPKEELEKVINIYEQKIEDKGIKLEKNIDSMPILIGDKDLINKVVLNILDNAYKYTKEGTITVSASYKEKQLIIVIEDTGIGIKKSDLQNIFTPFSKSSDTKNTSYSGMGLGLSITKSLIDKLNGDIKIESKYKFGTKVEIKIKQEKAGK